MTRDEGPRARAARTLLRSTGALSTEATARMDAEFPWFRQLSAEERSWVAMIVQAGVRGFVEWYADDAPVPELGASPLAASVFGVAPRALAGAITLQQTVALVKASIEVVESNVDALLDAEAADDVRGAVARYAREVAFATAEVYARAAEVRGAWDARLEALVVDGVLRGEADEAVLGRASALGWTAQEEVLAVIGAIPRTRPEAEVFDDVHRVARLARADVLCAAQGERLVVLLGGAPDPERAVQAVEPLFGPGPVVVGPTAAGLAAAHLSARDALAGLRAAPGWPEAPRPVHADDLLPERVLAGDDAARRHLVEQVHLPLLRSRGVLADTLAAWFAAGASVERTGRALFVHANTVRYRLRQIADLTGLDPADPRESLTLRIALAVGRQAGPVADDAPPPADDAADRL
ncbi:helix-turn-helix domain-containing protein [Nocardioides sp. TRM66260-LWL]|uniref:PucR family transcriptional regulator n=1 Tax=Nocardioides sp. TRM66260-LWL TaxID=2874478 RepID=UPI001CC3459A|nr:helix-turn-helix domain-containing protein [Nocardioides sp. TRM66260-LWL]MBZ5732878.1 helix-turn-helix domain-containing protein [Nocardioides sp. TRM66260-LWL]